MTDVDLKINVFKILDQLPMIVGKDLFYSGVAGYDGTVTFTVSMYSLSK